MRYIYTKKTTKKTKTRNDINYYCHLIIASHNSIYATLHLFLASTFICVTVYVLLLLLLSAVNSAKLKSTNK